MSDPLTAAAADGLVAVLRTLQAELPGTIKRLEQHPSAEAVREARSLLTRLAGLVGTRPGPRKPKGFDLGDLLCPQSLGARVNRLNRVLDDLDQQDQRR